MTTNPSNKKSPGAMDEELLEMLKYLRLRRTLSHWDETLEESEKGTLLVRATVASGGGG